MIRRPPRSTLDRSSAASDVYKRQINVRHHLDKVALPLMVERFAQLAEAPGAVSYTHLRAHETGLELVCRLLLATKHPRIP